MQILLGTEIIGSQQLHTCLLCVVLVLVVNLNFKTTGTKYVATKEAIKEALLLKALLTEINELKEPVVVYSNCQSVIRLCKNLVFY